MSPRRALAGFLLAILWFLSPGLPGSATRADLPALRRVLGPLAGLAASAQWVRADLALEAGREDLAWSRAERALALDPSATDGWYYLARHLALDRSAADRCPDQAQRAHWFRLGLAVLKRGEAHAANPAELVLDRGLLLAWLGSLPEGEIPWPGGAAGAWGQARQAFLRAAELGHPQSAELAERATLVMEEIIRARDRR
ncbi:MAG: hypothetical protein CMK00_09125 [Planctomycetes bacterium]|nr:hypothetical protein [Planctomycetota bacterium]HJO27597.1 hypothetical protein [Planctomycetota bacterium]